MSEQADAVGDLREAGVLRCLSWAGWSAYRTVIRDYQPATGHDQGWIGYTGHKLMINRQDRIFSCRDYAIPSGDQADAGADLLQDGISEIEYRSMPVIEPGLVVRGDVNGSPGWRFMTWRWLMISVSYGEARRINWNEARPTKRSVASRPFLEGPDLFSLLEEEGVESVNWRSTPAEDEVRTLVMAHSVDPFTGQFEGFIGHPKLSSGRDEDSWHWLVRLDDWSPDGSGRSGIEPFRPTGPDPTSIEDAAVRLRRDTQRQTDS
jgi:hypothetical protein